MFRSSITSCFHDFSSRISSFLTTSADNLAIRFHLDIQWKVFIKVEENSRKIQKQFFQGLTVQVSHRLFNKCGRLSGWLATNSMEWLDILLNESCVSHRLLVNKGHSSTAHCSRELRFPAASL
jgi:hypothetical protein